MSYGGITSFKTAAAQPPHLKAIVPIMGSDVDLDGHSTLVTTGWLQGSHRVSHAQPEPLARGEVYEFHVPLWATSYQIPQGHRLRVSVSCADFPRLWPTRTNPHVRLFFGGSNRMSAIRLPTVPPTTVPGPEVQAPDPQVNRAPLAIDFTPRWKIERDLASGTVTVTTGQRPVLSTANQDGRIELDHTAKASVSAARPAAAKITGETTISLRTPSGNRVVVETHSWVTQRWDDSVWPHHSRRAIVFCKAVAEVKEVLGSKLG